ncbi:MAG: MotA/TolQ/ExbB proton channel family protein [Flavobacteriales bacterium]|jgi:biopolymer transport protein ExbB|nr:MotA/TolQ/ExbB proton channel family protein [Flavobacteriales bacterium]
MKNMIKSFAFLFVLTLGLTFNLSAQDDASGLAGVENTVATGDAGVSEAAKDGNLKTEAAKDEEEKKADLSFSQKLKQKFIQGDPLWMTPVLLCLIIGMALSIERVVYLNLSTIDTKKFKQSIEDALKSGGVEAALDVARNTRGPIASIYYQGLSRADEGVDVVEKSIISYGGVQNGLLEKGMTWLQLFIALSPMLGFLGTVIGMIQAFEQIVEDGQVSPITVAGGIQVSLLTTVFGLISAIILQIFYNYITSKVDGIVNEMEEASISLIDMMLANKVTK